jgi:hypothetical protein
MRGLKRIGGAAAVAMLVLAGAASAGTLKFTATLKGADEVPATTSAGTGEVTATLDTSSKMFTYQVSYSGLTGAPTMAHFHGPAAPGANAGPVVAVPKDALGAPMKGMATLTDAQVSDLEAGRWYFNIHTAANPGGEVRGQVTETK